MERTFAMNPADFSKASGITEFNEAGEPTFLPNPIPTSVQLSPQTIYLLSQADRKFGQLNGAAEHLPNPNLVIGPFIQKESVLSSRLEGTHAKLIDVFKAEIDPTVSKSQEIVEVSNATNALVHGLENITLPLPSLAKDLHRIMFDKVKTNGPRGDFRKVQNFIGPTARMEDAWYIPPRPERLDGLMQDLDDYFQSVPNSPPLIRAALIHYQFESIHPFTDGNGRIGRTITTLYLVRKKVMNRPILFMSEFFNNYKDTYWDLLLKTNKTGDFEEWLRFFLHGVIEQSDLTLDRVNRLMRLKEQYHDMLKDARVSQKTYPILDEFFKNPFASIPYTAKKFKMSFPTSQKILENQLCKLGILKELTSQKRNRIFYASDIISIIDPENYDTLIKNQMKKNK